MINHAMFQRNGRCGYVLKPRALRTQDKRSVSMRTRHYLNITVRALPIPRIPLTLMHVGTSRLFRPSNFRSRKTRTVARSSTSLLSTHTSRSRCISPIGASTRRLQARLRSKYRTARARSRTTASTRFGKRRSVCRLTSWGTCASSCSCALPYARTATTRTRRWPCTACRWRASAKV